MVLTEQLLSLEKRLWTNDPAIYESTLLPEAALVFAETGLITRRRAVEAIRQENAEHRRWVDVSFADVHVSHLVDATVLLHYRVTARWEHEAEPIVALAIRPNQGPIAALTRPAAAVGSAMTFDASGSFDPDGEIARYDWDFGDGQGAVAAGPNPVHAYAAPGRYRVTVTVTDNEGCSNTQVFTGQTALCNGSNAATLSRQIHVR